MTGPEPSDAELMRRLHAARARIVDPSTGWKAAERAIATVAELSAEAERRHLIPARPAPDEEPDGE